MQENGSVTQLPQNEKTLIHKLDRKTLSAHRGVVYQTKGKGPLYTSVQSVQSDGALRHVHHDLTIWFYSSTVDRIGLILVPGFEYLFGYAKPGAPIFRPETSCIPGHQNFAYLFAYPLPASRF